MMTLGDSSHASGMQETKAAEERDKQMDQTS